jgi:hypothetical protein
MSNAPSTLDASAPSGFPDGSVRALLDRTRSAAETAQKPFQFVGFWSAVVLPFVYAPMVLGGFASGHRSTFAALLAFHAVALVAGHGHRKD